MTLRNREGINLMESVSTGKDMLCRGIVGKV